MAQDLPVPPPGKPLTPRQCRAQAAPLTAQLWMGAVAGWHPPHPGFLLPQDTRQHPGPTEHVPMSGEGCTTRRGPALPASLKLAPPGRILVPRRCPAPPDPASQRPATQKGSWYPRWGFCTLRASTCEAGNVWRGPAPPEPALQKPTALRGVLYSWEGSYAPRSHIFETHSSRRGPAPPEQALSLRRAPRTSPFLLLPSCSWAPTSCSTPVPLP